MTDHIPIGTPCYLVHLADFPYSGRIVEVIEGPKVDDDGEVVYVLDAPWVRALYQGRCISTARKYLRPITPPDHVVDQSQPTMIITD